MYISDGYGNSRVLEYNAKGERVRQWGTVGSGPSQFQQPHGIAVDDQGQKFKGSVDLIVK